MSRWCMSDLHGCLDTFNNMLNKINFSKKDELIIIGDLIDRGPQSKQLIDYIIDLKKQGFNIEVLLGNHEDFLLSSIDVPGAFVSWMHNGGIQTLQSYGFDITKNEVDEWYTFIPDEHFDFLESLPLMYETDKHVFVHAGLNFHLKDPLKNSTRNDVLWERYYKYDPKPLNGRMLITGHTPQEKNTIIKSRNNGLKHMIIDCGCVFHKEIDYGFLCCFNIDNHELIFERNCDIFPTPQSPLDR